MKRLTGSHLHRWWIPLASGAIFFLVVAFLIPYSASLWEVKKSLAGLILAMSNFGQASPKDAPFDYTYCLFVPLIFAYLVHHRWKDLGRSPIRQSKLGLGLIILGVLVYWFGLR